jgi:hypothetical protein
MRVITRKFSNYYDIQTATQFSAVLDRQTDCYIGVADVSAKTAKAFSGRIGFDVVSDEAFLAMITKPADPEPTQPDTGDPLTDNNTDGPPAPPSK